MQEEEMLDLKFIRNNKDLVQKASNAKNFPVDLDKLLKLDSEIIPLQQQLEELQAKRNKLSKTFAKLSDAEKKSTGEQIIQIKQEMDALQSQLQTKKSSLKDLMLLVAQPARDDVPIGKDDNDNQVISTSGKVRDFDFPAKDHIELGEKLGLLDFKRGVKLAGSRSYVLTKEGALLEKALMRFVYDFLLTRKFTPISVPVLVNEAAMEGTGYFPVGKDQSYFIEKDKLALVGTSEVPICSLHSNEILAESTLPLRYMAETTCFRREAGTYGKDTRGLYRVHQFQKIEMVILAPADKKITDVLHEELLENSELILQALKLPYRKVYVCTGDLGQGQVRKHDLETWMPSRESYGETHSCSSFYDFQSRRLKIRYKTKDGKKHFVYTLNNTACASPRMLIPLIENYQTKDGRIEIPEPLRKYMNNMTHIGG